MLNKSVTRETGTAWPRNGLHYCSVKGFICIWLIADAEVVAQLKKNRLCQKHLVREKSKKQSRNVNIDGSALRRK